MGLFKNKEQESKNRQEQFSLILEKYNLRDLPSEDQEIIKQIAHRTAGTDLISFNASAVDSAKLSLLNTIVEQNWVIMKLLNDLKTK
uniref:Precorrin-8X methylmutase n=1 Tax=Siphoviridae sp. ctOb14 TaxID=2827862 RepID=A0A8S5SLJ2_9CAUD|nr:MAG TPA: Precorrin-8X methylmutase [Siphoviridae sp. ctOb14]